MRTNLVASSIALCLLLAAAGCSGGASGGADLGAGADLAPPPDLAPSNALVAARPYEVEVPPSYDGKTALPLVIVLHGFGVDGLTEARYLGLSRLAPTAGFLLAYPEGTKNEKGQRFWNAGFPIVPDAGALPDDIAYVEAVIDDVAAHYAVDRWRVHLVGHSNGAFLAQYFACRRPERVASLVSLAGGMMEGVDCKIGKPVQLVEIHGTMDDTIELGGGSILGMPYRPLNDVVDMWVARNRCLATPDEKAPPLDLEASLPGDETKVSRYLQCEHGGLVELWTIRGGGHIPTPSRTFAETIWRFLKIHPRPDTLN